MAGKKIQQAKRAKKSPRKKTAPKKKVKKATAAKKRIKKKAAEKKKATKKPSPLSQAAIARRKALEKELERLRSSIRESIAGREKLKAAFARKLQSNHVLPADAVMKALHNENMKLVKKLQVAARAIEKLETMMVKK